MSHSTVSLAAEICALGLLLCVPIAVCGAEDNQQRVEHILVKTPLVDGHFRFGGRSGDEPPRHAGRLEPRLA